MASWEIVKDILKANPNERSPKQIADFLGVKISIVYKWAEDSEDGSGSPIPYNQAKRMSIYTGDTRLVENFAEEMGGIFLKLDCKKQTIKDLTRSLLRMTKEFGELASMSADALSDGRISDSERKRIHKESQKLVAHALCFDEVIQNG